MVFDMMDPLKMLVKVFPRLVAGTQAREKGAPHMVKILIATLEIQL